MEHLDGTTRPERGAVELENIRVSKATFFHHFPSFLYVFEHFELSNGSSDVQILERRDFWQAVRAIAWSPDGEEVYHLSKWRFSMGVPPNHPKSSKSWMTTT